MQLRQMRTTPDWLLPWCTTPLSVVALVAIFQHADRAELAPWAVLAPALMGLWSAALLISGEVIEQDRAHGRLEALLATPGSFAAQHLGRMLAVTLSSLGLLPLAWGVGSVMLGDLIAVPHPWLLGATLALTAVAMCAVGTLMSCVFVLARSARTFQNSLSYPFFVLGGVLVPVALLPAWLHAPASLFFLSWSSDLMRDALDAAWPVDAWSRLGAIAGLGAATWALSALALRWTLVRARRDGSLDRA